MKKYTCRHTRKLFIVKIITSQIDPEIQCNSNQTTGPFSLGEKKKTRLWSWLMGKVLVALEPTKRHTHTSSKNVLIGKLSHKFIWKCKEWRIAIQMEPWRTRAGKIAQWVKGLATRSNDLIWIPGTHLVERELIPTSCVTSTSKQWFACVYAHT